MQTAKALEKRANLLYPLMVIAAVTVIVFCIVGTATLMGWLPRAQSNNSEPSVRSETVGKTDSGRIRVRPPAADVMNAPVTAAPTCTDCGVIESRTGDPTALMYMAFYSQAMTMPQISDYLLRVIIRDNEDYMRLHNRLTSIPGVLRVQSSFALKTVLKKTEMPL